LSLKVLDVGAPAGARAVPAVAVVGAGWLIGDLLRTLGGQGLAAVTGTCGSVGVAGLTLGGGVGLLSREHGLAADQVR
jgi:hypothetical protein